jgi:formylglycine-generating enzyme required for sulfatase activity
MKHMLGTTLAGRYKIVKHLGGGGFGSTFLAADTQLPDNPVCVVKQLKPLSNNLSALQIARTLFDTEAKVLHKLGEHDQIPGIIAHFEENQEFYLVREFIEGDDLSAEIKPACKWTEERVIAFLLDVLTVLSHAHQEGAIHRDIKPANLIRRRQDGKIVLIDFAAIKQVCTQVVNAPTQANLIIGIGTPGYMPSEQAKGNPQFSSDVYALGMTAIQALTGIFPRRLPENPQTGDIIWRNKVGVSPQLGKILDTMVRRDSRRRYPSAVEALQAVSSLMKEDSSTRRQLFKAAGFVGIGFVTSGLPLSVSTSPPSGKTPLQQFAFDAITVDTYGREISRTRRQAEYFAHDLGGGLNLEMVSIPGGIFLMGSPKTESGRYNEESPQHLVKVQPFFMGKYAVTQAQWKAVAALPKVYLDLNPDPSYFKGANKPVENVSWYDAVEFCARLSQATGRNYRLPSEAEWEYACRAHAGEDTRTAPFHFGETVTTEIANYHGNYTYASEPKGIYSKQTADVGSFPANTFGLYDTHGNVWEWCADPWHDNYTGALADAGVWDAGGNQYRRLLRGGSWFSNPRDCRSAFRCRVVPDIRNNRFGFRVALSFVSA